MNKKLMRVLLWLMALSFATVSLVGCGSSGGGGTTATDLGDFLYATDADETIDIIFDTDYLAVDTWGSGALLDNAYTADPDYNPCFAVDNTTAPAWGGFGAVAFTGFDAGYFSTYTSLNFKFKAMSDSAVNVKFPGAAGIEEIVYNVASAQDLGNGWYDFTIRLANHGDLAATTEFAILATGDFLITDIYFTSDMIADPAAGDIDGDARFYIKSGDGNRQIDLVYGVNYDNISDWGSNYGAALGDVVDATYGDTWSITPGNGWGIDAGAIAFSNFSAGFAASYSNVNFKFNSGGVYTSVSVKFPGATTEEIAYDLATYGTALGGDWYEVSIPLTGHGDLSTATEFAILGFGTDVFYVTDLFFD